MADSAADKAERLRRGETDLVAAMAGNPRRFGGNTFGGAKFGGNTFGGATYGGNQFGASAQPPAPAFTPPPLGQQSPFMGEEPMQPPVMMPEQTVTASRLPPQMPPMPAPQQIQADPMMAQPPEAAPQMDPIQKLAAAMAKRKADPWTVNFGSYADQQG